jgi:hypothetical protein
MTFIDLLKFHPHKKPCEFSQTRDSAPTDFYRFFAFFCVFRPALEPDKSTEKPGCIEGLFSGICQGTPETVKNDKKWPKSENYRNLSFFIDFTITAQKI